MIEDCWRIVGGEPLHGVVCPSGSKNGALPTLAATLLLDGETVLRNVPRITDVATMIALLQNLGLVVEERSDGSVRLVNHGIKSDQVPADLVQRMRASHYLLAPMVLRLGRAEMPLPGGCQIGERPISHILAVLQALGVQAGLQEGRIVLEGSGTKGTTVVLDPQHRNAGATFTGLMAGALAEGITTIENASYEPDVVSFCAFLKGAGLHVAGVGTPKLIVRGTRSLGGANHRINPDRLEAGTFVCAAAATRGEVTVEGIMRRDLGAFADKVAEAGVELREGDQGVTAACRGRPQAVEVITEPFPGYPTDLQPPLAAVLTTGEGTSRIRESVFGRRLQYVDQLVKMGAQIQVVDARNIAITGVHSLHGAEMEAGNIRDGAALVTAALSARGESVVSGGHHLARGYQALDDKLRSLGAKITAIR